MTELEDALGRAERELAETKAAITLARGKTVDLATKLVAVQAETAELDARALSLEEELSSLRDEETAKLAELAVS